MKSLLNSKPVMRWSVVLFFIGAIGAAYFWMRSHSREPDQLQAAAREPDQSEKTRAADDVIQFPSESWQAAGLRVDPVKETALSGSIELTGKIALNEDKLAHVFPLVEGRVDEVKVQFGQKVKKGDLLVIVQSREVSQAMLQLFQDRLKLEFAEAQSNWLQNVVDNTLSMIAMMRAKASIDDLEKTFDGRMLGNYREKLTTAYVNYAMAQARVTRLAPLSQSGTIPARQTQEAESELNATRASLQALLEQVSQDTIQSSRLATQAVKELQTNIAVSETNLKILGFSDESLKTIDPAQQGEALAHYWITAPFDGTVISKDVVQLERVSPDRQILTIADLSTVWVTADIYEAHLPLLAKLKDQSVYLRCDAWPDRRFQARIFYSGDVVQEATRTLTLRAVAENQGELKPGMFVTVELPSLDSEQVLQVAPSAIQEHEGQAFVFVQTGDELFTRQPITIGRRTQDAVEVKSGLKTGDRVVVTGGFALKSRMLVDLLSE